MSNSNRYNIYCDESCHLENDGQKIMVIGAVWCPVDYTQDVFRKIRDIKNKHCLSKDFETKWNKVSPAKIKFYIDLVSYFFKEDNLHFRALIANDKDKLRHADFNQDHDTWYYKMYFYLLNAIFSPKCCYRIYLDIKDTHSSWKVRKLHDVLCKNLYDFSRNIIERVQTVHSHEVEILQLTDLLIGAVSYVNRDLISSDAKLKIVEHIKKISGYGLRTKTLLREDKFNLFFWTPKESMI